MRILTLILLFLLILSCKETMNQQIFGLWKIQNRFYEATYHITEEDGMVVARVMKYDDGTTKYLWDDDNPKYLFRNLQQKGEMFVDAVSGATKTDSNPTIEIEIWQIDSLRTTIYSNHHPRYELWQCQITNK